MVPDKLKQLKRYIILSESYFISIIAQQLQINQQRKHPQNKHFGLKHKLVEVYKGGPELVLRSRWTIKEISTGMRQMD